MKLIHAILGVGAASLLPTALAQEPAGKPFVISFESSATPIAQAEHRYPTRAAVRGIEGACNVRFTISTAGQADGIRVGECTSEVFRRSAKMTVEKMSFAPRASATQGVTATIRWAMPKDAQVHTASLN